MPARWWENLINSPGAGQAFGQFGSSMLAAPNFNQGFAALGQMPSHLAALGAQAELQEAEKRRQQLEEQLADLRIQQATAAGQAEEMKLQALPGQLQAEAEMNQLGLGAARRESEEARKRAEALAAFGGGFEGPLGQFIGTDPNAARGVAMAQADRMLPQAPLTEEAQARIAQIRAATEATLKGIDVEDQRIKDAQDQRDFTRAAVSMEGAQKMLIELTKLYQDGNYTEASAPKKLTDQMAQAMAEWNKSRQQMERFQRQQQQQDPASLDRIRADLMSEMTVQEVDGVLGAIEQSGRQEEMNALIRQGMTPRQALRKMMTPSPYETFSNPVGTPGAWTAAPRYSGPGG